jgi:hypothetical protein
MRVSAGRSSGRGSASVRGLHSDRAERPRGAIASLPAQFQPVAVTEPHPLARSVRPLERERAEFRALQPVPLSARIRSGGSRSGGFAKRFGTSQASLIVRIAATDLARPRGFAAGFDRDEGAG